LWKNISAVNVGMNGCKGMKRNLFNALNVKPTIGKEKTQSYRMTQDDTGHDLIVQDETL
jgi:hypothetical protein